MSSTVPWQSSMAQLRVRFLQIMNAAVKRHPLLTATGITGLALVILRWVTQLRRRRLLRDLARERQLDLGEYDVIIVGGGTSGCVLAARLSEDPSLRVLMLEAGRSGKALLFSQIPSAFSQLFHGKHVFNLRTEPQTFADGKRAYWPRGKLLGGCSSINAQMAQYGCPGDFDQWAALIGDPSWSWNEFQQYFRKFENFHPDPDYPPADLKARGDNGPVTIGYYTSISKASKQFIEACTKIGIPFLPDLNGVGVSRMMSYVDSNRQRVSAETAYLTNKVLERPNLTVVINAQVTKILFDNSGGGVSLRAIGAEFSSKPGGRRFRATASKEVILSAGAVHSPQILMLSGVGPADHLESHGVPVLLDLRGVGSNLVDHPVVDLHFRDRLGLSIKYIVGKSLMDNIKALRDLLHYLISRRGVLTTNVGESAAFCRSDDPTLFPPEKYPGKITVDSTSALDSPDLELFCTPASYTEHGQVTFDVNTIGLHAYLLRPTSRGSILLRSSDPWDPPSVNPNYLQTPEDLEKLVRGVKLCLQIAQTEPLASHLDQNDVRTDLDHQSHLKTDEEIAQLVKTRCETLYHPTSTMRMAPREAGGVCDADLKVYGTEGLRVCDASFFPWIVSGHTAGACFASAEKLADLIKSEYRAAWKV